MHDGVTQVATLRVPHISSVNFERLRRERLGRLQASMKRHNLAVALFFSPSTIRYATGTHVMEVLSLERFERYAIVPAEGDPIVFEYEGAAYHSTDIVKDVRFATTYQFSGDKTEEKAKAFADQIYSTLKELGLENEPLGVDRLDTPGFMALHNAGLRLVDPGPAAMEARHIKTQDEVALFKINGAIGSTMLADFEAAIRPGVREYELLAEMNASLIRNRGEYLFLRMVASGRNTNPWYPEASSKQVMPGDLVGVDTDAHGMEGYVIDVSRTFLCGDVATTAQKEAYRVAFEAVNAMVEIAKPGMSYEEFARLAPELPAKFKELRYECMAHTVGLEDADAPTIPYPDVAPAPEGEITENMVMNMECYAGEVGAEFGVKLEDQVLITKDGAERLVTYPFEAKLLN